MTLSWPLGTPGKFTLIDESDQALVAQYSWRAITLGTRQYAIYAPGSRRAAHRPDHNIYMHRLIMGIDDLDHHDIQVDHINGDGLDNRRCNLRLCSAAENKINRRKGELRNGRPLTSCYKGVSLARGKYWRAQIGYQGERIHLGHFPTEEDAARAYDAKAREMFGEFALVNFDE
jgi:hypothetical protein